jgi:amino-acid N-acetyltransferase
MLVAACEQYAIESGIDTLYLLTETAETFFECLGYTRLPRDRAPAAIVRSAQFASLCPSSAAFMARTLRGNGPGRVPTT